MIGATKAMKKNARKSTARMNVLTKADINKLAEWGYAAGVVNREPKPPDTYNVTIQVKAKDAYMAGWWRGFSEYSKGRAQTA